MATRRGLDCRLQLPVSVPFVSVQIHQPGIDVFDRLAADLPQLLERLLDAPAAPVAEHAQIPNAAGIYLFSELDHAIYVSQTRKLKQRLRNHTNPLGKNNQATFAFLVAKEEAEKVGHPLPRPGRTRCAPARRP